MDYPKVSILPPTRAKKNTRKRKIVTQRDDARERKDAKSAQDSNNSSRAWFLRTDSLHTRGGAGTLCVVFE
jgi:hypothetical protein